MENILEKEIYRKREKEKKIVKLMILLYCKDHKHLESPCESFSELIEYVNMRIDTCPFTETKTYCSNCKVHCYKKDMRDKIKEVMRYAGPRIIFSHPMITIDHMYQGLKHKYKEKSKRKKI